MLKFHITRPYPCGYLPERQACSEVVASECVIDTKVYGKLMQAGFRRSGQYIYRPNCAQCHACISARVNVNTFVATRSQRRSWKKHCHLTTRQQALHFKLEHYALYQGYQAKRHEGSDIDEDGREQYQNFLLKSNVNSKLIEFYEADQLRMVSIIDELPDGLSSVYTFFDPSVTYASFGTYNILWQIKFCQELGLAYLYLGYWIKENRKMSYKANFQPLEVLIDGQWRPYENIKGDLF